MVSRDGGARARDPRLPAAARKGGAPRAPFAFVGIALLAAACSSSLDAASPSVEETARAREFVAAKLEGRTAAPGTGPGIYVLASYGRVTADRQGDLSLALGGRKRDRGLYCHAPSEILLRAGGACARLVAEVGVTSNRMTRGGAGSVVFAVRVEGREVFRSGVLREGMDPVPVLVDLGGRSEATLVVEDGGDGISCDQAVWADLAVERRDGSVARAGDLPIFDRRRPFDRTPPFSFLAGEKPSSETVAARDPVRVARDLDRGRREHVLAWSDSDTGLTARLVAIEYLEFPTVEWTLYLENEGSAESPLVAGLWPLDLEVSRDPDSEYVLHHHTGDTCSPESYAPHSLRLDPSADRRFAPVGGRPTSGGFPYFDLEAPGEGILLAIGWPGQWEARFIRDGERGLRILAGQELARFRLRPGERVRTPSIVLQFRGEDRIRAHNVWRRWMLAHKVPKVSGAPVPPILSTCSGGFFPGLKCNQADELLFVRRFAEERIPLDAWWMDAGWYPCPSWDVVGTWEVDRTRFPGGLRAIGDAVKARGMKLIVWFEPERVAPGTWLAENRSEWIRGGTAGGLLDLGNPEARSWLADTVGRTISEEGIDVYRQDFNIEPLPFWRAADEPGREGIAEIRHVEGYLAYWDELRRRHPDLLIDSCASGGRRNDIETLARAVPLLRSDYQSFAGDPSFAAGNQGHTYGLAFWIPWFGQGAYYNPDRLVYSFRSHMCAGFGMACDVRKEGVDWESLRRLASDWKAISRCFLGDYYPLTPYSLSEDVWIAWQFDLPEEKRGAVQAFRREESPYESARFRLRGLDPEASYVLRDLDSAGTTRASGRELIERGLLVVARERPAAAIVLYERE